MLILEGTKKVNDLVYTTFSFPGNEEKGSAVYDASKGEFIEALYGEKNPLVDFVYGFGYVRNLIEMMIDADRYPDRITYEWY